YFHEDVRLQDRPRETALRQMPLRLRLRTEEVHWTVLRCTQRRNEHEMLQTRLSRRVDQRTVAVPIDRVRRVRTTAAGRVRRGDHCADSGTRTRERRRILEIPHHGLRTQLEERTVLRAGPHQYADRLAADQQVPRDHPPECAGGADYEDHLYLSVALLVRTSGAAQGSAMRLPLYTRNGVQTSVLSLSPAFA